MICNHLSLMNKTASESVVCICKLLDIQSRVMRSQFLLDYPSSCLVDVKKEKMEVLLKTNLVLVLWMYVWYSYVRTSG